jgi:hypothetical protein
MTNFNKIFSAVLLLTSSAHLAHAQPPGLVWTPCNTYVLDPGMGEIELYDFFSVFNSHCEGSSLPTDVGFSLGLFEFKDFKAQVGIDYIGGTGDPLFFNGKIGIEEKKLFPWSPSFSIGILGVGTRTNSHTADPLDLDDCDIFRTNWNIVNFVVGQSLPECIGGTLYFGAYSGSKAIGKVQQGGMVGYIRPFCKSKDCEGTEYDKWVLYADWASGKNLFGGGGVALEYYFNANIGLETGATWFNTEKYNGAWKWTVQCFWDFPVFKK